MIQLEGLSRLVRRRRNIRRLDVASIDLIDTFFSDGVFLRSRTLVAS